MNIFSIGNSTLPPAFNKILSSGGIVKIARKLVSIQIRMERGTLPRAMAVRIVPDDTVTGAVPIIQTPTINSCGNSGNAKSQAKTG
jgi:hypothetical protein